MLYNMANTIASNQFIDICSNSRTKGNGNVGKLLKK